MKKKLLIAEPFSIFLLVSGIGIIVFVIRMAITQGDIATWLVMEHNFNWQFTDFYRQILFASNLENTYSYPWASFPPLAYCFFHLLYIVNPVDLDPANVTAWTGIQFVTYNPLLFLLWNIVLYSSLFVVIEGINKFSLSRTQSFLMFLLLIFSAPFMSGAIERGNPAALVFVLLLFSLYFSSSSNMYLREIGLILIAIAAGWKIYPAIFGFLYLQERRYKEAVRLVIYGILFFFVPFVFTGGLTGFKNYIYTLTRLQGVLFPRWTDIKDFYAAVVYSFGGKPSAMAGSFIQLFAFAVMLVGIFISKSRWHAILFASAIMSTCISGSYRYVSIYMAIPLVSLFAEIKQRGYTNKLDYINVILFALTFTIPIYGYILNIGECDMYIFLPIYLIILVNVINVYVTIHSRPVGMTSQAGISPLPDRV